MNILSLHSQVVAGHVGNGAAVLPLQLLGFEVWAVSTVLYSNHPGHGTFTGRVTPATEITALVDGLDQRGLLASCDGVLVGYLGDPAQAEAVSQAIIRVRAANPHVIVCCDPVLGDRDSGLYVSPGVPEALATHLIPIADIVTPNHFELEHLSGAAISSLGGAVTACQELREQGSGSVVCTSLGREGALAGQIETLLVEPKGVWLGRHDAVADAPHGTGDMLAALMLGHRLLDAPPDLALKTALASIWSVIRASVGESNQELALVAAQDQITAPSLPVQMENMG
jgi:pyridoxine kinase